ncbi:MAG: hypothetical protein IPI55_09600 [Flavobacteriales bacterium]|nr:hypothetical protein [Flavobacteriales bacterium]
MLRKAFSAIRLLLVDTFPPLNSIALFASSRTSQAVANAGSRACNVGYAGLSRMLS